MGIRSQLALDFYGTRNLYIGDALKIMYLLLIYFLDKISD